MFPIHTFKIRSNVVDVVINFLRTEHLKTITACSIANRSLDEADIP